MDDLLMLYYIPFQSFIHVFMFLNMEAHIRHIQLYVQLSSINSILRAWVYNGREVRGLTS